MNYNNKEEIIKDYAKFITFVLKSMNLLYRQDELFDVGMIGFTKGLNSYNEKKGFKYSTYLYECIKNEIFRVIEYENRPKRDVTIVSLNQPIEDDTYKTTELQDMIPFYENYEDKIFLNDMIFDIMRFLGSRTKRQEDIFKYYYGIDGYPKLTLEEIAKKYDVSKQAIRDTLFRTMRRIKEFLRKKGYYER